MNAAIRPITPVIRSAYLREPEEIARIDTYVSGHADGTPFHRPCWGQAVERGTGHPFHMLIAEDGDGVIMGLLPVHIVHSPLFGRALVSSSFAVGGGPLVSHSSALQALSDTAWQMAQSQCCPTAELRGGPVSELLGWICKADSYAGFVTDLAADDDAQLLAIPRKQRAEVRKGLGNGLTVRVGTAAQDRADHYAVYAESVRNLGTPVFPRSLFDAVLDAFGEEADILTVYEGERPVASVLSLYHNGAVMPYWGGGVYDARRLRANDVMYYALMNHARGRGCTRFDFGRSKTDTGAYHFKRNWGFEPQPLAYAVRTADGEAPRDINPLSPKYRLQVALWQKLPLSIANRLGPMIARGLG